jgi:phospholipid N-methyltransferase
VALVRTDAAKKYLTFLRSVLQSPVTANVVPSSPILATMMMEAFGSSETSVLTRATRCNIPEDGILHSHRPENLKSYITFTGWAL